MTMLESVLVANRGEIAVRVLRTARRLGLRTIAVYSDADSDALHVQMADEAVHLGAAPARDSYLNRLCILDAARRTRAAAIHPGYGFLSENADFAQDCAAAGVCFVGPPVAAVRAMGSKSESKRIMATAGVPLVPGYHGADQSDSLLALEAQRIGWPVLVKASMGGGGKGMRIVREADELAEALAGARREAHSAFGDATLLLEKYLQRTRHVEVQVFADTHGQCVALFDRDCSLQRRHQKVIEEAPAPGLSGALRQRMADAAVAAARAVNYVGAGTVEFLVEGDDFYFIEMNTRLQVEHPVTEMITGIDLVEWQLRVASGEPMPLVSLPATPRGHAFEARLYAEDSAQDFLPSTGTLQHLRFPEASAAVRIDSGVREGDAITVHYDPMIAKLIVWGEDRAGALRQLRRGLSAVEIAGLSTNTPLLAAIAAHDEFAAGQVDTGFIARHAATLLAKAAPEPRPQPLAFEALGLAAVAVQMAARAARAADGDRLTQPDSPWHAVDSWRGLLGALETVALRDEQGVCVVQLRGSAYPDIDVSIDAAEDLALRDISWRDNELHATRDGRRLHAVALIEAAGIELLYAGLRWHWQRDRGDYGEAGAAAADGAVRSPMPGTVIAVLVAQDQAVERGAPLLIVEAMKMEHTLRAPAAGRVQGLRCSRGSRISEGEELLRVVSEHLE